MSVRMRAAIVGLVFWACLGSGLGVCPHDDRSVHLKKWSDVSTWPRGKPGRLEAVQISSAILLDEQPPELYSVNITATGRLVWSPHVNITLTLKYIYIRGRLDVGAEDCLFTGSARIVLTGRRGEFHYLDHMGMAVGDKFILVDAGGTLELHGRRKLPWTKLTRTLPKLSHRTGLLFDHLKSENANEEKFENGLVAYVFNVDDVTGHARVKHYGSYEVISSWQERVEQNRLADIFKNLVTGDILALGIHYKVDVDQRNISRVCDALETAVHGYVTFTSQLRNVRKYDAYTAIIQIGVNGQNTITEHVSRFNMDGDVMVATSSYVPASRVVKISVVSQVNQKYSWLSYVNFRVITWDGAFPRLDLLDDTSTWQPGDRVVLTSTDYDWQQAETATVVFCPDCNRHQIRIDLEVRYEHFGEIVDRVDMRGEVALLSRNIRIEGAVEDACVQSNGNCAREKTDTFGGQTKFLKGSTVHIEGVELYHMGQQTDLGMYPIHFHMAFDTRNMKSPPYVRENSIHHSFARCVTIHGTHGVTVKDNVCYETRGHAYFVEDGGEHDTLFDGNLVASVRKGFLLSSDNRPSGFWITSPKTRLRNNVAAGGEAVGIWYLFPVEPVGPSRPLGFFQPYEADRTPLSEFDNNVAHSNLEMGLLFDSRLQDDGGAAGINAYFPKADPLNPKSADREVVMNRLTAYKNRYMNTWIRGGLVHLKHSSLSDSSKSITMARSTQQSQLISDTVMIGLSRNKGEPSANTSYSLPVWFDVHAPIQGLSFYDGPVLGSNLWFDGFVSTPLYKAGAIGFERYNAFTSSAVSGIRNVRFGFVDGPLTGNRVYDGDEGEHGFSRHDGDKSATVRDIDTSLTGRGVAQIVKPWPFYTTPGCRYRANWNMAICPHRYGKLRVAIQAEDKNATFPVMSRDDIPDIDETLTALNDADFLVILGGTKTYSLHWTRYVPETVTITSDGLETGQNVRFGVCLPLGATFDLSSYSPRYLPHIDSWSAATSLQQLDAALDGTMYYHDGKTGMVYFNFALDKKRQDNDTTSCPGGVCPSVTISGIHGNRRNADCRARIYGKIRNKDNRDINIRTDTYHYAATMQHPPSTWGAGPTKPFTNRDPRDGNWGLFSTWTPCSATCGGGQQFRTRACDSPLPVNGGKMCTGPMTESRTCNSHYCPVNGAFSDWSSWGACVRITGCQGYKRRSRTCTSPRPRFGGYFCRGANDEVEPCALC